MICDQKLVLFQEGVPQWGVVARNEPDVLFQSKRPVVVRLISDGIKYMTKEGYIRDRFEHDMDVEVNEYEVELADMENEVARFVVCGVLREQLSQFPVGSTVAIGFQKIRGFYTTTVWEVER